MTDDERGPDDRQPEGAEPDGAAADGAAPDDASDWLAAQFGEDDDDDDAQAAATDATDREPSQAVDTEPGLRPDAEPEPEPEPDAATRALPTQPAAGPSPDDDLPPIVPAFVVPAAPTGETDVPRSSGHPMALDLSQLKGSVEAPEPPAATDETVAPVEPATAAPATAPADAPADDDAVDSGPPAPPVFSPPVDEPARPGDEPGPFTALIASALAAPAPSVFDWDALPARDAQPEPVPPSATEPEPVEALVDDDGHEEARPEPDAPTRAVETVAPAAAAPETAPADEVTVEKPLQEREPEPEADPASELELEPDPASEPEPEPEPEPDASPEPEASPVADEELRASSEPDFEAKSATPSTPAAGSAPAAGQGDPWWVEEHHEMTRRERRLAEAAAAAAAAAASAAAASAASSTSPPAARPASEPTFTELLGISVPDRDQDDDEAPADVPGDGAADAGRHDPVEEPSAGSWSLSSLDDEPDASAIAAEGEADDSTDLSDTPPDDVPDDDVSDEHLAPVETAPRPGASAPTSSFPPPYRPAPEAATAAAAAAAPAEAPTERPRTTPSTPGELPGLSVTRPEVGPTLTTTFPVVAAGEPYGGESGGGRPEGIAGWSRNRKLLLGAAAVLVVVLALLALFFLSRSLFAGAPEPTTEPAAATTQTVVAAPAETAADVATGPLSPGAHAWSDLQGGECFATFENAWQQEYDVVDCGAPHAAQLASTGTLPGDAAAAFPGADTLQNQMTVLCTSATALDLGAAASYADLQFSASYPTTSDEWAAGARTYSCFVDRSGGEALATSLAPTAG